MIGSSSRSSSTVTRRRHGRPPAGTPRSTSGLPNYTNNLRQFGYDDDDFAEQGSDRLVDAIVAWGDIDAIVARVRAMRDAGADHVCVQVIRPDNDMPTRRMARARGAALLS